MKRRDNQRHLEKDLPKFDDVKKADSDDRLVNSRNLEDRDP